MQFRDHAAAKKRDSYNVDPRALKIDPAYNVRDMQDPETIAHVRWLADSIKNSGLKVPLEVRVKGEDLFVVAGHCRHAAIMLAISEGCETLKMVLCVPEASQTDEIERTLSLVTSNSGKPLSALAVAEVVRRLLVFGWDTAQIADRFACSVATVDNHIALLSADADVKQMVRSGAVAASTAAKVVKKEGSAAGATLKAAAAASKSGEKITAKTIRQSKGEFDPNPKNVAVLVKFVRDVAHGNSSLKKAAESIVKSLGLAA